ncbi:mitochondrial enolase superfamily member 1 [Grus japonensis]|uniref:Mitochondrial enolase superfamily member 1 n=1 Tax=Grus japonensis TaxID=30415 RepID=A0ABC9YC22_GRUJA
MAAWLLRSWDNGADSQQLEGREAQQLGSLARNRGTERGTGKEAAICSLWRRLLSSVRARYPFEDEEKAEVLNAFFTSVFSSKTSCSLGTQPPELEDRDGEQNEAPIIQAEMVSDLLHHLDTHKTMGPDWIPPRVLRELAEVLSKPLSIIYQQSWLTREVLVDWRLANVTPIHKKGQKEDPGNYRPVSLTSVPGKVIEQIILSAIMQHVQDKQVIRPSQHGFIKGRSCLTNLISFYDQVTFLVDEGKAVDVVYLDFRKAFDTVSHSFLLEKPADHGLDERMLCWVKKLAGWLGKKLAGWLG